MPSLKAYCAFLAAEQAAVFMLLAVLEWTSDLHAKGSFPVYLTYPSPDARSMRYEPILERVGTLNIALLVQVFTLLTAFSEGLQFQLSGHGMGERALEGGSSNYNMPDGTPRYVPNYVRWAEFGVTSTFMLVAMARLAGVVSVLELSLLAVSNAVMITGGINAETLNSAIWMAGSWALHCANWAVVGITFLTHIERARTDGGPAPPHWLPALLVLEAALFGCFGAVPFLVRQHAWPPEKREKAYKILSGVSKTCMELIVAFGVLA